MLEPYENFFKSSEDAQKFEKLEMDNDSLYLTLSEDNLKDILLLGRRNK